MDSEAALEVPCERLTHIHTLSDACLRNRVAMSLVTSPQSSAAWANIIGSLNLRDRWNIWNRRGSFLETSRMVGMMWVLALPSHHRSWAQTVSRNIWPSFFDDCQSVPFWHCPSSVIWVATCSCCLTQFVLFRRHRVVDNGWLVLYFKYCCSCWEVCTSCWLYHSCALYFYEA